jgi:hypothetical protein
MTNDIAKEQMCILMRNGIEMWIDKDKAEGFGQDWVSGLKASVKIDGRYLNSVDIIGIFLPEDLDKLTRKKQGQWQDKKGEWHDKNEVVPDMSASKRELDKLYKNNPMPKM